LNEIQATLIAVARFWKYFQISSKESALNNANCVGNRRKSTEIVRSRKYFRRLQRISDKISVGVRCLIFNKSVIIETIDKVPPAVNRFNNRDFLLTIRQR
jgi:hypothetical protein